MTPVLGSLQSIGPNTQASTTVPDVQSGNTVVQILQPQTQSQQTQFVSQSPKQQVVQQPSAQQQTQQSQQQQSSFNDFPQFLTKTRLQDLVKEVDPTEQLDDDVEEMLLQLADDFVETTVNAACLLAKHRHANTVEVKDVQLHLEIGICGSLVLAQMKYDHINVQQLQKHINKDWHLYENQLKNISPSVHFILYCYFIFN
ncbi:transcription initiation factor TFIID subunit 12b isoform X1 [Bombus vosnesenskii]|uniref:Transcription initiation factor TFIID subunit 12 n=2 Tax=Pyrobombus TaxID=144703 RepID=A0A6J3JYG1_9HYME|nr:transcription initiation factor TFIID subunit 12b isoform X1 [Bombus vancouverensis nearcticus]XP_033306108.1 transcription initiation factor TFIID subunit 12b isoform X1 [Bombus bifarius]XP_033345868.1 transcription initiation factor TFIID subunit 12b isoform X1 [Bombus vosnesenskii]